MYKIFLKKNFSPKKIFFLELHETQNKLKILRSNFFPPVITLSLLGHSLIFAKSCPIKVIFNLQRAMSIEIDAWINRHLMVLLPLFVRSYNNTSASFFLYINCSILDVKRLLAARQIMLRPYPRAQPWLLHHRV